MQALSIRIIKPHIYRYLSVTQMLFNLKRSVSAILVHRK